MAGIANKFSKCTPIESPTINEINTIQRSACFSSAMFSHFKIAQNTTAVHKEDIAYTSVSTAENQKVSENV